MAERARKGLFRIFATLWGIAAIYHLIGIFYKVNDAPPWRHAVFVCMDLFFAYGLLKRPKYFVFLFFVFLVQQYYTHGSRLLNMWIEEVKVDWISLLVLVVLPIAFVYLITDARAKRKAENKE